MIRVTRINGEPLVVNADFIEFIEPTPDTLITLTTGKKMMVRETVDEVIEKIVEYRQRIGIPAHALTRRREPETAAASCEGNQHPDPGC